MDKKNAKIGFDAKRVVSNRTGLGSYGRTLVNALAAQDNGLDMLLYAPDEGREDLRRQINMGNHVSLVCSGYHNRLLKDWWRTAGIMRTLKQDQIELYHGLSGELPHGIGKSAIKSLVTIHDLIFLRHPEYYKKWDVQIYKYKFFRTLREADRVIAISERTKQDILHYSDFPEERIDVIYQSCGLAFAKRENQSRIEEVKRKYHLPDHYVLNVGTIEARKNVLLAVKALQQLPPSLHLVIVGRKTRYTDEVIAYVTQHGLTDRVILLHGIPNDDLPAIYQGAEVFVYPSRYEGFGIPIIEAIQSGLPVVAATGSCLEEAGGRDCVYVDPDNEQAMAEAIAAYIDHQDYRQTAIARSRYYVRRFENKDIAQEMMREYDMMLKK